MPKRIWRICPEPRATWLKIRAYMSASHLSLRFKRGSETEIPYSAAALREDLIRVQTSWDDCQTSRDRNAIYGYPSTVFGLVMWWAAENRAISRARWALRLQGA